MLIRSFYKWAKTAQSVRRRLDQKNEHSSKLGQNVPSQNKRVLSRRIYLYLIPIYILLIFATLPLMPYMVALVENFSGRQYFGYAINALLISIVGVLVFQASQMGFRRTIQVLIPMLVLFVGVLDLEVPSERIHFLEYGILGFLVTKVVERLNWKSISLALLFVTSVGALDEGIQWILPNRVGDLRDVVMNLIGGGMGIWVGSVLYQD